MKIPSQILSWMLESLEGFVAHISLSRSAQTIEAYRYDVSKFLEHLSRKGVKRMKAMKPSHVEEYLGFCKLGGKSDASVARYYMSIKCYCQYLRKNRLIDYDLTQDIDSPRNKPKAPRVPSIGEIQSILVQPDISTEEGLRDRAMLELLYSSGLRASELCDLRLIDKGSDRVVINSGKGSKTRTVPINRAAEHWITRYLEGRESTLKWLFLTRLDRQFTRLGLLKMVTKYARKAGVEQVTPHTLRHACATHLLDSGADLRLIQEVLGHETIATTQRYTHLSSAKMSQMFNNFHPRNEHE